jgi:IS30 family transposase
MAKKKFFVSREELQAAYLRLSSTTKVAKEYDVSKKLVLNYMNKYGLERNVYDSTETVEKIKTLAAEKKTSVEIAEALSTSLTVVNKHIRRHDIHVERYHKGFIVDHAGYKHVKMPEHKNAAKNGYIREHILVMTEHLGRPLEKGECVHHIDRNKANNALENLRLMTHKEHKSLHSREPRKKKCQKQIDDIV